MAFAGTSAITELWAKAKEAFARKVGITKDTTSVTVQLKNNAGTALDTVTIPAAGTDNQAGVMTNAQATKLAGIAEGANNYSLPNATTSAKGGVIVGGGLSVSSGTISHATPSGAAATNSGLYKISTDSRGHVTGTTAVAKADITGLGIPGTNTTYSNFTGATPSAAGTNGLVPAPAVANRSMALLGDGTWGNPLYADTSGYAQEAGLAELLVSHDGTSQFMAPNSSGDSFTALTKVDGSLATAWTISKTGEFSGNAATASKISTSAAIGSATKPVYIAANGTITEANSYPTTLPASNTTNTYSATGTAPVSGKAVASALGSYSTTTQMNTAISNAIATAQVGAAMFQGTATTSTAITGTAYKKGMYWVVNAAGTYVGQTCEVGDMVFAIKDKGSAAANSDFSVVQNNIVEMTVAEVDAICV